ncbi:MAG: DUF4175 family protein [Candidatus Zixiibacteriota bacterium]
MELTELNNTLCARLKGTLLKKRLALFAAGLLLTGAVVLVVSVILSAIAGIAVLSVPVKIGLLIKSGLITLAVFVWFAARKLRHGSVESVAVDLETKYPELKGRLIAAIEFARMTRTPGYSGDLIAQTQQQAFERAKRVDFNRAVGWYPAIRAGKFFGAALVVAVVLVLLMPGLFSYSLEVYSNPSVVVAPPLGYQVIPVPGSVEWVKWRDIEIGAAIVGDKLPEKAVIRHRLAQGAWQETEVDLAKVRRSRLDFGDSLMVSMTLRQINRSFDYYVEAGRVKTEVQSIDVVDRPRVTGIRLSVFYPEYTSLPPTVIDENNGSFSALMGSRVNMNVTTNLPVQTAELVFADSSRLPMGIEGKTASAALVVEKSKPYTIYLLDHLGEKNPDPIEYYITAVPDEYPSIDVIRPGFDVNLNDEMMLPVQVRIFDDYGFSSLVLKYSVVSQGRQSAENVAVLHFSDRIKTEGDIDFNWDLNQMNLFPGDYVSYYFEVADNDRISGPRVSRSRAFIARLPSLDEIIADSEAENARRINNAESLLRTGQDLAQRLKNAARKLQAQNNELQSGDWQNQKELEAVLDKNVEVVEQIEELAEQMEKSVEELNDKALLGRELIEKLMEVQKLFEEVATPEMKEAQRKLFEALQTMDPTQLQQAINDFEMSQDELLDRLERTLVLLKKMQLEQKLEAMIRQVEDIAKKQENMNERAESSSSDNLPKLSPEEEGIKESLDNVREQADQLDELARMAEMEQSEEFGEFKKALEQTKAGEHMDNMTGALNEQDQPQAVSEGQKALSSVMEMLGNMQQQMMAMKGGQNEATLKEMRMALQDANQISRSQEELLMEASDIGSQSLMLREMASGQQDLSGTVAGLQARINELGKQSPYIAAELRELVDQAGQLMDMAMREFDSKNGSAAMHFQREAMYNLNRASIRLMESLNQQQQSQSGANCSNGVSALQALSDQQNNLNQQTQQMLGGMGTMPSEGQGAAFREALQRMAGEQGSIRKSLEDLGREFGGSRQILGRLDDIAKEMKEVEEALSSGNPGSNVTEQQLKIFSRMLEASRSLYRKDFSEERQSKTATSQAFYVPPELSREILDDRLNLEDRLRRYLGDDYPPQYEQQIKAYFKALLQKETGVMQQNPEGVNPAEGGQ